MYLYMYAYIYIYVSILFRLCRQEDSVLENVALVCAHLELLSMKYGIGADVK